MSTRFEDRAAQVKKRLEVAGISQAEAARQIGYGDESGRVYVRRVLNAMDVSNVILDKIEAVIESELKEHTPAG